MVEPYDRAVFRHHFSASGNSVPCGGPVPYPGTARSVYTDTDKSLPVPVHCDERIYSDNAQGFLKPGHLLLPDEEDRLPEADIPDISDLNQYNL